MKPQIYSDVSKMFDTYKAYLDERGIAYEVQNVTVSNEKTYKNIEVGKEFVDNENIFESNTTFNEKDENIHYAINKHYNFTKYEEK